MSNGSVKHLDDKNFEESVASGVSLIDFWAPWCGPCRMQGPIVEEVAEEADQSVVVAKVDVDQAPKVAAQFGVRSIPTLVVLKDGELVEQFVGVQQAGVLLSALSSASAE